jgi:hypothetical protein
MLPTMSDQYGRTYRNNRRYMATPRTDGAAIATGITSGSLTREMYRATVTGALYIPVVRPPRQPYALETPQFSFAAVAACAARSPLGGSREVAIAAFVTARLADDLIGARRLSAEDRQARATAARRWLSNMALPETARRVFLELIGATEREASDTAAALRKVMDVTAATLDGGARSDLERLVRELDAQPIVGT